MYKKFYHPVLSSNTLWVTCPYGYKVDGVNANTNRSGHLGRYAIDEGGESGSTNDWMSIHPESAPMKCVRITNKGTLNVTMFQTTEPVELLDGRIDYAGLELIHSSNSDFNSLGIVVGKVFNPGDRIYREGTGGATASHVHIQAWVGNTKGTWHKCASGYAMDGEAPLNKIAYVPTGTRLTRSNGIANSYKYSWIYNNGKTPIGEITITTPTLRVRETPSLSAPQCTDWAGAGTVSKGSKYVVYEISNGWARIGQTNRWVFMEGYTNYTPYQVQTPVVSTPVTTNTEWTPGLMVQQMSGGDKKSVLALLDNLGLKYKEL